MKRFFIGLFFLLLSSSIFAQVKNYIGIVRGDISKDVDSALIESKNGLDQKGFSEYSKFISEYLESCYGSGFVFVDKDGSNYIVTNLHVVSHANSASIEFEGEKGKSEKYDGLNVVYIDDTIDLALLRFKDNANPFKEGLNISSCELKDGDDVYSAGFPSFRGSPLWQLGKGIVSNSHAYIDELIDSNISHVIQHTAEIDGGNSGGPLLLKNTDPSGKINYEVVGINTWKAENRQNTNFAIPGNLIEKLINDYKKPFDKDKILAERKADFKTIVTRSHSEEQLQKYISYEAAIEIGEQCFIDSLNHNSGSDFDAIINEFYYSPIEGFRLAIAYKIIQDYKLSETVDDDFEWVLEQEVWRIKSPYTNKELNKSIKNYASKFKQKAVDVKAGVIYDFTSKKPYFTLGLDSAVLWNGAFSLGFIYEPIEKENRKFDGLGANIGYRIPFDIESFKINILMKSGFINYFSKNKQDMVSFMNFYYECGVSCGYRIAGFIYPTIGISYNGKINISKMGYNHGIKADAGVAFTF